MKLYIFRGIGRYRRTLDTQLAQKKKEKKKDVIKLFKIIGPKNYYFEQ